MKKPKRLIGYIKYDETDYPFEFDEEAFSLLLFPPTVDAWNHTSSMDKITTVLRTIFQ